MGLGGVFFKNFIQKLFFLRLLRRLLLGGGAGFSSSDWACIRGVGGFF